MWRSVLFTATPSDHQILVLRITSTACFLGRRHQKCYLFWVLIKQNQLDHKQIFCTRLQSHATTSACSVPTASTVYRWVARANTSISPTTQLLARRESAGLVWNGDVLPPLLSLCLSRLIAMYDVKLTAIRFIQVYWCVSARCRRQTSTLTQCVSRTYRCLCLLLMSYTQPRSLVGCWSPPWLQLPWLQMHHAL